jgi:alpha-glucoside transport system ATP-binding protein
MPDRTMIYVTHDQVEAMTLASRIVVLTVGQGIGQVGTPLELYETPQNEFVAQFIGSPAMNLMPGEIVETGETTRVKVYDGAGTITSTVPTTEADKGKKVNVGIRPEHFDAATDDNYAFGGEVTIIEALGELTQLYFDRSGDQEPLIAKLPGIHRDLRGNHMKLTAPADKVHLFHDGQSLMYR